MYPKKSIPINSMTEDIPIYTSTKDEQPQENEIVTFQPSKPVEVVINEIVKPYANPVYQKTVIPDKVQIVPSVAQPAESVLKVDTGKLTKNFSVNDSAEIIERIQNKTKLPDSVAEKLIKKEIIREMTLSETQPVKRQVVLNDNIRKKNLKKIKRFKDISGVQTEKFVTKKVVPSEIPVSKKSNVLDNITNFIYKLIYKK